MYLNTLDRQPDKKKKFEKILKENAKKNQEPQQVQEESKTPKPSAQEQTNVSTQQRMLSAGQKNEKKANKKHKKE